MTEKWTRHPWWSGLNQFNQRAVFANNAFGKPAPVVERVSGNNAEETRANAHLIAAAPDLYEALRVIADRFPGFQDREFKAARAALAKARGETG